MRRWRSSCSSTFFGLLALALACGLAGLAAALAMGLSRSINELGDPALKLDLPSRIGLAAYLLINAPWLESPAGDPASSLDLVVQEGDTAQDVIDQLESAGLVSDSRLMRRYLQYRGLDTAIQAGRYTLNGSMSIRELADALQHATAPAAALVVREGWRREQIAQQIDGLALGYSGQDFLLATDHTPADHGIIAEGALAITLEGFLFPDTYQVDPQGSPEELVLTMLANFENRVSDELKAGFAAHGLDLIEAVTLASILEREAVLEDERPLIAAVFLRRLELDMPLEADPTVQYALGQSPDGSWWKSPLSLADLEVDSPYNTYRYPGLPPAPIANPGLASLRAVAFPADVPFLYFRAACDGSGRHLFAVTFEEHVGNACP